MQMPMTRAHNLHTSIRTYIAICCHETHYNSDIPLLCMTLLQEYELSLSQSMMFYYWLVVLQAPASNEDGRTAQISPPVVLCPTQYKFDSTVELIRYVFRTRVFLC